MRRSRSIRILLLKHFLLASLLPTLLLSALLCGIGLNMLTGQAVQKNSAALEQAARGVDANLDSVRRMVIGLPSLGGTSSALSRDSLYSLLLYCDDTNAKYMPPSRLATYKRIQASIQQYCLSFNPFINGIHLILDSGMTLSFGGTFSLQRRAAAEFEKSVAAQSAELPLIMPCGMEKMYIGINKTASDIKLHSSLTYVSSISRISDSDDRLALLALDMNQSVFAPLKALWQSHGARAYALDAQGKVVYSSDGSAPDAGDLDYAAGTARARYDFASQRIICSRPLEGAPKITLMYCAAVNPINLMEPTLIASLLICLLAIFYAVIMTLRNTRRFSRPIMRLSEVMSAEKQLPRSIAPYNEISELQALYVRYNDMLDSISRYINQKYESELALERMKMRAMETQMNSHFLYNTLECIYSMALLSGADDVARVTKSLSDTFRYISRTVGATVTVRQEIMHVQDYVTIQRARLGDDVSCIISLDKSIWEMHMLKLTLQPLVENAIKHGLKTEKRPRNVYLSGELKNGMLIFTVRDNGVGMPPDTLEYIRKRISEGVPGDGVGIANVTNRLRLYYGEAASLRIESEPMQGTLVTLSLPEGDVT